MFCRICGSDRVKLEYTEGRCCSEQVKHEYTGKGISHYVCLACGAGMSEFSKETQGDKENGDSKAEQST